MNHPIAADQLLDGLSGQCEGAEVYEARTMQIPVRFQSGALDAVQVVETAGRALRLIKEGRLGFSTTTDLADGETVVRNALASAQYGDPVSFTFPGPQPTEPVPCFDAAVESLTAEELITQGEEIVERFKAYDPALQVDLSFTKAVEEVRLLNTSGLAFTERRTSLAIEIDATRTQEGDILIVSDGMSSRRRSAVDGMALTEGLIEQLRLSETVVAVESGAMPVVFDGFAAFSLLLPFIIGLSGKHVYMGTSPLKERLGQQAFDRRFTLVDDGRLDLASRSASWDDEGMPTARQPLVEGGIVRQFLYDLKTASQAEARPTGNGFKTSDFFGGGSFDAPPSDSPTTWVVSPGERSLDAILRDLDEALLVQYVLGLGQGNILAGEFSNNVAVAFLVRRGEIVGRVKNTMIAGNAYDLLRDQLIALSSEPSWIYGILHTPAFVIDSVGVVSSPG